MEKKLDGFTVAGTLFCALLVLFLSTVVPFRIVASEAPAARLPIGTLRLAGLPLIGLGVLGYLFCLLNFILVAKGTPLPGFAQEHLMVNGLYRLVRNPMYLSWFLILLGEALHFRSLNLCLYLLVWILFFHFKVVAFEEPALRAQYGESYLRYCRSVHRWLPRFPLRDKNSIQSR